MRRALLVVMLLAPALARAQITPPTNQPPAPAQGSGTITFANEALTPIDNFINLDECRNSRPISLEWSPTSATSGIVTNIASYTLYASDQADNAIVNTGNCPQVPGDKSVAGLNAGQVGTQITASITDPSLGYDFDTSVIASVTGLGACTATGQVIMLCVQARDSASNPLGTARLRLTVDVSSPSPPGGVSVLPGDKAANVSWQQSTGAPIAEYYRVEATSIGTTIDPGGFHLGPAVTGTKFRLGGLVNGGTYVVGVRAFSTADNPSEVTTTIVSPEPVADFWDEYKAAGGQETGGCSSGIAGPVGLAVLAGTLLLVRRRK